MCLMLYLAADKPLEMVAWDDSAPGLYVEELAAEEKRVRRNFEKPHVVYVGSHEGCGCGFKRPSQDPSPGPHLRPERRSRAQLRAYLERQVARVGAIELLACRDGDQARRPSARRTLTPAALADDSFAFVESELATVERR